VTDTGVNDLVQRAIMAIAMLESTTPGTDAHEQTAREVDALLDRLDDKGRAIVRALLVLIPPGHCSLCRKPDAECRCDALTGPVGGSAC
jgi:hypothetical protein